jgi:hypothetical protein
VAGATDRGGIPVGYGADLFAARNEGAAVFVVLTAALIVWVAALPLD